MSALIGVLALLAYAYGLGAASVIVWRVYRGWVRWLPGLATLAYYVLSWLYPHPAALALMDGAGYSLPDALRTLAGAVAFGLSLRLLAVRGRGKP
ncbi:hypothetical protein DEIPH_ctg063orf0001 [Deinococcus phoenicis]|uniref:Uncharacterized protein n=1 Tax=Deinococcus phoenicis TaxID=1476583 RepID=A0A016QM09_9DEIO|nr:hypothetical protein [Deinococcus phoenicis]EYB66922.1 hypothetical protein DEIPH_ctg063orf0001 [Deinococcus phoenicis]